MKPDDMEHYRRGLARFDNFIPKPPKREVIGALAVMGACYMATVEMVVLLRKKLEKNERGKS